MNRTCTRAELARLAGVSRAAVTKACRGSLTAAVIGQRIDLDHPATVSYLKSKGVVANAAAKSPEPARPEPATQTPPRDPPVGSPDAPTSIEGLEHLTLQELLARYGTVTGFKDWLDARKKIADTREKDLKNEETVGRLIPADFVRSHVFGYLDGGNRRLLRDAPKTLAQRLYAMARAGEPIEAAEKEARSILSDQLTPMKTKVTRALKNA